MATIAIKNIPPDLYDSLKQSASLHRRSINSQVCLHRAGTETATACAGRGANPSRSLRRQMAGEPLSLAELLEEKAQGRP